MKLRLPHRFQAALIAALASVSFTTLSSGSAYAADAASTNLGDILFMGDSITHGVVDQTYRWQMFKSFVDNGITFDINGPLNGYASTPTNMNDAGTAYGGVNFENLHYAKSSGRAYQMVSGAWYGISASKVGETDYDTYTLMIGTNDILSDTGNNSGVSYDTYIPHMQGLLGGEISYTGADKSLTAQWTWTKGETMSGDLNTILNALGLDEGDNFYVLSIPVWAQGHSNHNNASDHAAVTGYNTMLEQWVAEYNKTSEANVQYVDVNKGITDLTVAADRGDVGPYDFFRNNDRLHPSQQGSIIIGGNLTRAMGLAGRTAGLHRSATTEAGWTAASNPAITLEAGDSQEVVRDPFTEDGGYTVDFKATFGNGGQDGWLDAGIHTGNLNGSAQNVLAVTVGDGINGGTLNLSEGYIMWGSNILYCQDNSQTSNDAIRIAYHNGSTADNVAEGYYVWLGDMLIGQGLGSTPGLGWNGIKVSSTGGTATLTGLMYTNTAYAPTTGYAVGESPYYVTQDRGQTEIVPTREAAPTHDRGVTREYDFTGAQTSTTVIAANNLPGDTKIGRTTASGTGSGKWYAGANGLGADYTGDLALEITGTVGGNGIYGIVNSGGASYTVDGDVTMQMSSTGTITHTTGVAPSIAGGYYGSITGKFRAVVNSGILQYGIAGGYVFANADDHIGSVEIDVNGGTVNGNVYGGSINNAPGTVDGDVDIYVNGGTINGSVYGGGTAGTVSGNANITITGGTIDGSVIGTGTAGTIGGNQINITLSGGVITGDVLGRNAGFTGFTGTTSVTVDGYLPLIKGNISADNVTLRGVQDTEYAGYMDTYRGTVTAGSTLTLENYKARDVMAKLVTQGLRVTGTTATTVHDLTLTACDIQVDGGSGLTLADTLKLGATTTYSGNIALADGLVISMDSANEHDGYSDGSNGYLNNVVVFKQADTAAPGSSLEANWSTIHGAGILQGAAFSLNEAGGLTASGITTGSFYVTTGTVYYGGSRAPEDIRTAREIVMRPESAATLVMAANFEPDCVGGISVEAGSQGARLRINAEQENGVPIVINASAVHADAALALEGDGTYEARDLTAFEQANGFGLGANVTLDGAWSGTVRLADSTSTTQNKLVDFTKLGNSLSTVELTGLTGWASNWSNGTIAQNIKLTDKEGAVAWKNAASNSSGTVPHTNFTGKWCGDGTFEVAPGGDNQRSNYTFSGDISAWTGKLLRSGKGTTTLTFAGKAREVNAAIERTGGNVTLAVDTDASFNRDVTGINSGLTVSAGKHATFNATTSISGTSTIGGTVYNTGAMTLGGTVNLNTANMAAFELYSGAGTQYTYSGTGSLAGSGFLTNDTASYYLVKSTGSGTLAGAPTVSTQGYTKVDGVENALVVSGAADKTNYYVNTNMYTATHATLSDAAMLSDATGITIKQGITLTAWSANNQFAHAALLHGEGTYELAKNGSALNTNLSVGSDWTGTVRLVDVKSASNVNFANLANGNLSTIELKGFSGFANTWYEAAGAGVHAQNLKLTNGSDGFAWKSTGATGGEGHTAIFSGTWSGDGVFQTAANKLNFRYEGDISAWNGTFHVNSGVPTLTFTKQATVVNATIEKGDDTTLNVVAEGDIAFNKAITADTLAVTAGHTATLAAAATLGGLTGAGDIASTATITLNGTGTGDNAYTFDGAITGAHLLDKTGAGTQTINGPVTVDRFTIGGGTTTFNGLVAGTAAGYSGNDRRMSVSSGTVYFNNGFAYSGGDSYALVTSANTTVHFGGKSDLTGKSIGPVATAKIVLDAGASLKVTDLMNSTANKGSGNGTLEMKSGSELTVAGKMYLTDASSNGGTIHLGDGSTVNLYAGAYTPNIMEFGLGAVVLDGAATTIQTTNWGGTVVLDSIAGTGTLTLKANADSTVRNTFSIGGNATESKFTGTIALERATGSNRVLLAEFKDMYSAAGAVVQASLSGNHSSEAVGILINSDVVQMKGLNDGSGITSANSYALASGSASRLAATNNNSNQYLDNASDGTFRTLEFTGTTATESYSTAIKVLGGVNLKMSGEGKQTFSGDMSAFDGSLTVNNGTLAITGNNGISAAYIASDTSDGTLDVTGVLTVTGAEAGMADFTGSLKVGGLHVDGGFNKINGIDRLGESIQVNNGGYLLLGIGTYELSGLTLTGPGEVTPTEGNGYTSFSGTVQFITLNDGDYAGSDGLTFKYGKYTTHTLDQYSGVVTFDEHDYTTYYVNGDATYSDAEMGKAQYLQIKEGQVLTAGGTPSTAKTLVGSGTYALASNAKTLGDKVSLDADNWTGTVAISNVAFANDMKGTLEGLVNENSWVALKGTSGWAASCTINANLLLENGNNNWAFAQNDGNDGHTLTFAGKIAGDGKLGRSSETGSTYTYEFTNDISKWNGTFESRSFHDRYTMFRVKDAATEVNASLTKATGVFKVDVQNQATFNGAVSSVDALTVADNQSATFTSVLEVSGTINLGTGSTLTLTGDTAIAQAIAGTATSTVVFNQDITASGLAGGQRDYFTGLNGQKATDDNYFIGKEAYLTVVTGGGIVNTGGYKVTQDGKDYLLDADGTAAGEKDIDYTSFRQFQAGTTLNASTIAQTAQTHGQTLGTVSTAAAKLTLDCSIDNVYLFDGAELDITNDSLIKKELAAAGDASISGYLTLTQNATFSLAKWKPSSVTFTDSPFEVSGVTFTASAGTGHAVVSYTGIVGGETDMNNYEVYGIANANFKVAADVVRKNIAGGDATVGNKIEASEVRNDAPGTYGALILTSGADAAALKKVIATSGNIEFYNMSDTDQANLDTLNIGADKTVSFYKNGLGDVVNEAQVTVNTMLKADVGARLNADLEMASGSTLDVSAFNGNGGLFMGSSVTLDPGNIALSDDDIAHVLGLGYMEAYDLFRDVEDFNIGSTGYESIGLTDQWVKASEVFDNDLFKTGEKEYYVFYSGTAEGGRGGNVGTIYLLQAPEPTTGTLSLLALCALAARRRK